MLTLRKLFLLKTKKIIKPFASLFCDLLAAFDNTNDLDWISQTVKSAFVSQSMTIKNISKLTKTTGGLFEGYCFVPFSLGRKRTAVLFYSISALMAAVKASSEFLPGNEIKHLNSWDETMKSMHIIFWNEKSTFIMLNLLT